MARASASPHQAICTVIRERTGTLRVRWSAEPGPWRVILADFRATLCHLPGVIFDGEERVWIVPPAYADPLTRWMGRHFPPGAVVWEGVYGGGGATGTGRQQGQHGAAHDAGRGTDTTLVAAFATLDLLPTADPALVAAAHRIKAQRVHPDHGGDHQAMVVLNRAVEIIRTHQQAAL